MSPAAPSRDPEGRVVRRSAAGLGIELLGAICGFGLLGYWIDRHFGTSPWGLLTCLLLGLVGGLYNFIRDSLRALKAPPGLSPPPGRPPARPSRSRDDGGDSDSEPGDRPAGPP